ncbi:MAG TPA: formylglycine-generating enzyme family protein [Phenylobacterium sp.]|jgi:formylglycine-generating enzyme required for sulfatase activity|nr:formylglycine-generating enzyme family protein [Phenylobacterium sp.]
MAEAAVTRTKTQGRFAGMRLLRGGSFRMGSDDFYADERPVREARVGDFWIDETPVTAAAFARFVEATGYVTFAEIPPNPADYPGMAPEMARAGSLVFMPPEAPVDLKGPATWWRFVFGADWRKPLGPAGPDAPPDHPAVHIAHVDAAAYARWARKELPSEAEWEYAARGGLDGAAYAWGEELAPGGQAMAKTWQGIFPHDNRAPPGLERTSPVRAYPPNGHGLYDMIGNVWEWTDDWYALPAVVGAPGAACCGKPRSEELAAAQSCDPASPVAGIPRRVAKGGSHLCAPNYCQRYRPAARWPQPIDTTTSHMGFRCVVRR